MLPTWIFLSQNWSSVIVEKHVSRKWSLYRWLVFLFNLLFGLFLFAIDHGRGCRSCWGKGGMWRCDSGGVFNCCWWFNDIVGVLWWNQSLLCTYIPKIIIYKLYEFFLICLIFCCKTGFWLFPWHFFSYWAFLAGCRI